MEAIPAVIESEKKPNKYFLVGGFLSGAEFPIFNCSYPSFTGIKKSGSEYKEYSLNNQTLNFWNLISIPLLYARTRSECSNNAVLSDLQKQLFEYQPTIIICHSLGCHFFNELHRQGYVLPSSIKEIRFVQADVETICDPKVQSFYSWKDPVLHAAKIANLRFGLRDAGLFGDPNHPNNIESPPDLSIRHTGIPIIDWHLDSLNSMKE